MNNKIFENQSIKLWNAIDRIFHINPKEFLETMDHKDKIMYEYSKLQLINNVVSLWREHNLKPIVLNPQNVIDKTKNLSFNMIEMFDDIQQDITEKLLEMSLRMITYIPSMFHLNENFDVNMEEKYKINIMFLNTYIDECIKYGKKYSSLSK